MDVGDEQIYRVRFYGPSERVRVVGIEKRKQSIRADVEFLDGTKSGQPADAATVAPRTRQERHRPARRDHDRARRQAQRHHAPRSQPLRRHVVHAVVKRPDVDRLRASAFGGRARLGWFRHLRVSHVQSPKFSRSVIRSAGTAPFP
jgi:hypothetical protein